MNVNRDVIEVPRLLAIQLVNVLTGPGYLLRECQAAMSLPKQLDTNNPLREFLELVRVDTE